MGRRCLKVFVFTMLLFSINAVTVTSFLKEALPTSTEFIAESLEHELIVDWIVTPKDLNLGESAPLNASVSNMGLKNETNVELFLLINGSTVGSRTFPELRINSTGTLGYTWAPEVEGMYNVTAFSPSVVNEANTTNNVVTKIVQVYRVVLYVDPLNVTASVGETFTVNVKIANVTRLYGVSIQLRWSPITLEYVSRTVKIPVEDYADGILHGPTFTLKDRVNEAGVPGATLGTLYWLSIFSMGIPPPPSFNGSGTIFNMTFRVLQEGECDIYFTSTDLTDNRARAIPHEVKDGYFYMDGLGDVPVANFTFSPSKRIETTDYIVVNTTITFDASMSYDPDGENIARYFWDFGDGTPKENTTNPLINHTFTKLEQLPKESPLDHFVTLTVLDVENSTSKLFYRKVTVAHPRPVAKFTVWPPKKLPVVNKPVTFNASESYTPDAERKIELYMWDFGDGTKENRTREQGPIVNHTYTEVTGKEALTVYLDVYDGNLTSKKPKKPSTSCSLNVIATRDIEITNVMVYPTAVKPGFNVTINATVTSIVTESPQNFTESFNVTAFYNHTATEWIEIYRKEVNMSTNSSKPLTFYWNTTGAPSGASYRILVKASEVPHETNVTNNVRRSSESIYVTTEPFHDIAVMEVEIVASFDDREFVLPVILGENATIRAYVMANGNVPETFNATIQIIAPNDTALHTESWNESLPSGEQKKFEYIFGTKDVAAVNYRVRVNATITNATIIDKYPDNNFMEETFRVISPPDLRIAPLPDPVYVGDEIIFDATDSQHPNGTITEYKWELRDPKGTLRKLDDEDMVNFTFPEKTEMVGEWTVLLIATDNYTITFNSLRKRTDPYRYPLPPKPLSIHVENPVPTANFTYSPDPPRIGETVTFNASSSLPNGGSIAWYLWDFGDGTPKENKTNPIVTHNYTSADDFNVTLTITDSLGLNSSVTKTITVLRLTSTITLSISPETIKVGESVTINGTLSPQAIGANINVTIRVNGTDLATVLTDGLGNFTYTWRPDEAGTYMIEATWPGDANYLPHTSSQHTVTVEAPPSDILPYAVAGIVAIAVIAAVAIYFAKIRKKA